MSDITGRAAESPCAEPRATEPAALSELADVLIGMSRLLDGLGTIAPLRNAGLSLADWIALSALARGAANNNRQLAKVLGVTRQRANQIKTALQEGRLISASQSDEDARISLLSVTDRGRAQLAKVNAELGTVLSKTLGSKRPLGVAKRSIKVLTRIVRADADENPGLRSGPRLRRDMGQRRRRTSNGDDR